LERYDLERQFLWMVGIKYSATPQGPLPRNLSPVSRVLQSARMTLTEFDRRQMLEEFNRVHKGLEGQEARFDKLDDNLASVRAELKQLRTELENLKEKVDNISVDRKAVASRA